MRTRRRLFSSLAITLLFGTSGAASANLEVFTCEPEWAALAEEIGGDQIAVKSATTAFQDVHRIQARPSLIAKLHRADLLICSGADLEIGWLPVLLRRASNARVQPGQVGHLDVSKIVPMLDVPTSVDRAEGDVHPFGNPHTQTDPRNLLRVAQVLSERLQQLDPENAEVYRNRSSEFESLWRKAITGWEQRALPLRGVQIITYHKTWAYMTHWLGLEVVGQLEDKPGIPPTAGHLADLLARLPQQNVALIIRSGYEPERPSKWLSERSGIPDTSIPHTVGATPAATNLYKLFDDMLDRLLAGVQT